MRSRRSQAKREKAVVLFLGGLCFLSTQVIGGLVPDEDHDSVCQNLAPSPALEQFVDELPKLKSIRIKNGKQLTLGVFKITQVRRPKFKFPQLPTIVVVLSCLFVRSLRILFEILLDLESHLIVERFLQTVEGDGLKQSSIFIAVLLATKSLAFIIFILTLTEIVMENTNSGHLNMDKIR